MQRQILIIDDFDDVATALKAKFAAHGHRVETVETRNQAVKLDNIDDFDLVVTDLSNSPLAEEVGEKAEAGGAECLPEIPDHLEKTVKAFKICASGFRCEDSAGKETAQKEIDEKELEEFIQTILDFKAVSVDKTEFVKTIREKIEFEIPSAISLMNSILEYLMKRVEKVGVVNPDNSNLFIALDEAFVNAVKHGNKFDAGKMVRITAEVSTQEARFTIEDEGEGFDINSIPDPLDPENLFKASGRGVLIIHNVMDEVKYNERGNKVEMVKKSETEKLNVK